MGAAFMGAALIVAGCGGAPPASGPNGGCSGVWSGTECVHDMTIGGATPAATGSSIVPSPATPPTSAPVSDSPSASAVARVRDPRASQLRTRALPLLVTEVQQLEALAAATPDTAPDKTALLRRLAEDYVELATAGAAAGRPTIVAASRKEAIKYYDLLLARFAAYPMLDEVAYFDALEHERSGDLSEAARLYIDLIAHHPTSKFVPYAYFAFGETFASKGDSDPSKLDLAIAAYQKAVAIPPPDNRIYGWAWLRIGNAEEKKGDAAAARDAYAKAREFATTYPQIPGSSELAATIPP
jgi:tetratricopeptide (TPR) repeat protein